MLINESIDLKDVLVLRHVPQEIEMKKVLPWLASDKPEIFNAYQQTQKPGAEKAQKAGKKPAKKL